MPPKKRVLAKVDSNVQIEATKGNQKGKKNKKDTIAAPVPAAEDPATETKVDEVRVGSAMLVEADSNAQAKATRRQQEGHEE